MRQIIDLNIATKATDASDFDKEALAPFSIFSTQSIDIRILININRNGTLITISKRIKVIDI